MRKTADLDDELAEWLESEADRRARSEASLIREAVRELRDRSIRTRRDAPRVDALQREVDSLRRRVDRLEGLIDRPDESGAGGGRIIDEIATDPPTVSPSSGAPGGGRRAPPSASSVSSSTAAPPESGADRASSDANVLDSAYPASGRRGTQPARREAGRAALAYLREDGGPLSKLDFLEYLGDEHRPSEQRDADVYWREAIRPALEAARDAGLAERESDASAYHWTGGN